MTIHDLFEAVYLSTAAGVVYAVGLFFILNGVLP